MPTSRDRLTSSQGPNGDIFAIGGYDRDVNSYMATVEKYDVSTDSWSTVSSMPTSRGRLAVSVGPNGDIFAIGGWDSGSLATVERYDVSTDSWSTVTSMPTARSDLTSSVGPNGDIYVIGGEDSNSNELATVEKYDVSTDSWSTVTSMPTARNHLTSSQGPNGDIFAIGGSYVATVEKYDVSTDSWSTVSSMPTSRGRLAASVGPNGDIFAIGGYDGSSPVGTVERYSFSTQGVYNSNTFTASEEKKWTNITAGGVTNGYLTNLTVQSRNSTNDIIDTYTLTSVLNNTNTYTIPDTFSSSVNTSFKWSLEAGSIPTVGNTTIQGVTANKAPVFNNLSWNNSNPQYGDSVSLELNTTDPDNDAITSSFLETVKNGTQLFKGNGTQNGSIWYSPSVKVDQSNVWYNGTGLNATDSNGATASFGNTASFYIDNPPPQIMSGTFVDDRRNSDRRLELVLDDRGQSDVSTSSGLANVTGFSNSSLVAGISGSSLDSEVTVSDRAGLASDPFTVNVSVIDSGLKQNQSFAANLSAQRVIQELNISNRNPSTSLNYSQKFVQVNGDNLTDTVVDGAVDPGTSVSNVAGWEGDWITGLSRSSFSKYQSASYDHNEDAQGLVNQTELLADNAQPLEFSDVDISSVCSQTSSTNILPGDSVSATTDCNRPTFEVDYIDTAVGSESQDPSKASDLQTQYLQLQKNISETGGYSWGSVTIFPASIDGSCIDCSNRDRDIGAGQQISEIYNSSGDWISGETEDSYEKYASSEFDHSEEEQKLVNQTRLVMDNQRSIAFSEVNITGQCSNAELVNIASGTDITATTNCSTPTFTVDLINQTVSDLLQDESYSDNLSSQGLVREKQLVETGGYNWSKVNVSALSMPGDCENCGQRNPDIEANSTVTEHYNSTSDWVQEQAYNTTFSNGQVIYGSGINQRFNASQQVYTNNTQSVGFDVDFTGAVSTGLSNCGLVNKSVQRVAAGNTGNHSFVKKCNPGKEIDYTPIQKTDLGVKYEYNLTSQVKVFSELTSDQEQWIGIPQKRLDNWKDRNPTDTEASVNGQSSEVRVEQGVINGTEYVFLVVSNQFGSSSLHTGEHTATLIYTTGSSSSSTESQIGSPIGQVSGTDYSWDLYNIRSQEQEDVGFSIAGVPGREFDRRLAVKNTGEKPVTLELECVSQGDACNWVNSSVDRIRLDTQDNTVSYFDVSGRVPRTAEAEDDYRFSIRVSDPSFDESTPATSGSASADFVVSISPFFGSVIEGIRDLLSWREVEPPEWAMSGASSFSYPFAALPLFSSIAVYGFLGLLQRRYSVEVSNYDEIGKFTVAFLVFVVVTGMA